MLGPKYSAAKGSAQPEEAPGPLPANGPAGCAEEAGERNPRTMPVTTRIAVALSLVAAPVHLWVAPEHFAEWWGYGAFFVVVALAQGLFGVALLRWPSDQPMLSAAIWVNLLVASTYVLTRTLGVPLGPHAGHVEEPAILGAVATAAEVGLVVALVGSLRGAYRSTTIDALFLLGMALWVLRLTETLP